MARHHRGAWGDRPYEAFAADFEAGLEQWDPQAWAERFRDAGARYVVLVSKHHDGFCLWPTGVANPNRPGWHSKRDVVGELAEAVRGWACASACTTRAGSTGPSSRGRSARPREVAASIPQGDYPAYAEAHVRELIERYRPSVLWNDIAWPGRLAGLVQLIDHYRAAVPDGLVNDRWLCWSPAYRVLDLKPARQLLDRATAKAATRQGGLVPPDSPVGDIRTPEYMSFDHIRREPWECVRGIDKSFGFNRNSKPEHFLPRAELLSMVADIASKGGNLLLNVGPRGEDAEIPDEQLRRLTWLGEWTSAAGDALYATRPWVRPAATRSRATSSASPPAARTSSRTCWPTVSARSPSPASVAAGPARSTPAPKPAGPPTAKRSPSATPNRRTARSSASTCVDAALIFPGLGACRGRPLCPGNGTEDDAGLGLGVEEGGLRGHALAGGGVRPDLGDGGRPDQHAGLGLAGLDRLHHAVDAVLVGDLDRAAPRARPTAGRCRGRARPRTPRRGAAAGTARPPGSTSTRRSRPSARRSSTDASTGSPASNDGASAPTRSSASGSPRAAGGSGAR